MEEKNQPVCEALKKAPKKKLNISVKQGNKLHTPSIRPLDFEKSQSYIVDLYDDGHDQRVEDSNVDFLYQCNVRRSPRLKIGYNQVNSSSHRTSDDVSIKQDMASTIVHSTNARDRDKSKGKRILIGHEQCRSLVVNGDVTPSILTTKAQNAAYVTPMLRRSPRLKNFKMMWLQVAIESVISMHNTLYQEHMKVMMKLGSNVDMINNGELRLNNKRCSGPQKQVCTEICAIELHYGSPINILDDGMVFSEDDFKKIDKSVQKKCNSDPKFETHNLGTDEFSKHPLVGCSDEFSYLIAVLIDQKAVIQEKASLPIISLQPVAAGAAKRASRAVPGLLL
ncbi:Uncharacterized protein Fot_10919 [Forsythia ovata]|uniref:Uncharacterized protein n=1 Tax=Forsythia ovata TaxID=205694 RepID=A0ABD1WI76_9LAMI